jgi:hypothetical protein
MRGSELVQRNMRARLKIALLVAMGLLLHVTGLGAFPYLSESRIRIVSEYSPSDGSVHVHSQAWEVVQEVAIDGRYVLKFYSAASGSAVPLCELKIPSHGDVDEIEWLWPEREQKKISANGLLIVQGFPAPCDILPIDQNEPDKIYEDRIQAGGRIFLKRYRVFRRGVNLEEAKENGWLRKAIHEPADLQMITVVDERNHLVVKQLWPTNGSWWIYEESPYRRSWSVQ